MNSDGNCPQCATHIPRERFINNLAVCECGWFESMSSKSLQKQIDKKAIRAMFILSFVAVALFAHVMNWGSYSLEIPFIKAAQYSGLMTKAGYFELAEKCIALNKWTCAKEAYADVAEKLHDLGGLSALATLQTQLGEKKVALSTFATYFNAGGKAPESALANARLLEEFGRDDEAFKFFEMAAANSGEFLPVQATSGIVRLMMKQGRYFEAFERIKAFHESAGNATGYLNNELIQAELHLSKSEKKKHSRSKRVATN